jgi:cation diffusion facilitator CzcD-associated flavoprotein CzcO
VEQGPRCAVVGSGLAALAAYATLRHGGLEPAQIVVLGTHEDPTAVWRERAASIRQRRMRSESDGHLGETSFPGLSVRDSMRTGSYRPLLASITNRYHPTVEAFLAHADWVRAETGWDESFRRQRVQRIRAADGGFELDGDGPIPHVLVATGHPGLSRPPEHPTAVHAYEPHEYASQVTVVGAGMAAATEWLNALDAGAEVVSIRRRPPLRRPLSAPRPLFSKRGLSSFHRTAPARRSVLLRDLSAPSYPPGREWDEPLERAMSASQFRVSDTSQTQGVGGQVICATGFLRGFRHDMLLADLVEAHGLETHENWIVLAPDSTVPALTDDQRTLSLAGVAGQWAFPAADTIAGAKYAARAYLRRICRTH